MIESDITQIKQVTKIYHCNDKKRVDKFVYNDEPIMSVEDGHWLGSGMYFWDNKSNALYWKKEKERKISNETYSIALAYASYSDNEILDLTDKEVQEEIRILYDKLVKRFKYDSKASLGKKLNTIYEFLSSAGYDLKVTKVIGEYPRTPKNIFFPKPKKTNTPHVSEKYKVIYSIKSFDIISNKKIVS